LTYQRTAVSHEVAVRLRGVCQDETSAVRVVCGGSSRLVRNLGNAVRAAALGGRVQLYLDPDSVLLGVLPRRKYRDSGRGR
jgi:hypothetical protein